MLEPIRTHSGDPRSPALTPTTMLTELCRRWELGERISVEDFVADFAQSPCDNETLLDLIYQEVLLREQFGELPLLEDYLRRFPHLADELRLQFELDRAMQALQPGLLSDSGESTVLRESAVYEAGVKPFDNGLSLPTVEGYEVLHRIGHGGMGVVFKARNLKLNRPVALKMLRDQIGATAAHVRRFLTEAQATARLQHPHIVEIYEVGMHQGHPFLAYEFLDGGTLASHINGRPMEPMRAAVLTETLAATLHFAHQHGVVHRDLKPANVLLQRIAEPGHLIAGRVASPRPGDFDNVGTAFSGYQVKIADFGLAKIAEASGDSESPAATTTGDILGTPAYMSPEQASGNTASLTAATDVYALGAILYELLTGRPPFVGVQPLEVLRQVISDEPVRPSQLVRRIPKDIQTICLKCLEKSPGRRYHDAFELAEDLARFVANTPIHASRASSIERGWRWCCRNPVKTTLAASVGVLLVSIAVVSSLYSMRVGQQLTLTSAAMNGERIARVEALRQLWAANLSKAEALHASDQIGEAQDGLQAIAAAQELGHSLEFTEGQLRQMRNATIACLANPDLRFTGHSGLKWKQFRGVSTDEELKVFSVQTVDDSIVLFRAADGVEVARLSDQSPDCISRLSPDGSMLLILDESCRVFRIKNGGLELIFRSARLGDWDFSPDSRQILGLTGDGTLEIFDLQTAKSVRTLGSLAALDEIAVAPDARRAALLLDDAVHVIDLMSGKMDFLSDESGGASEMQRFAWNPDSQTLAMAQERGKGIGLWNVITATKLISVPCADGHRSFLFNSTGELLLTYDHWSGHMQLWSTCSGEAELSSRDIALYGIARNGTGGFSLLQMLEDDLIGIATLQPPEIYRTLPMIGLSAAEVSSLDLSFSSDGGILAVEAGGIAWLFDAETLRQLDQLPLGSGFIRFDCQNALVTLNTLGLYRWPSNFEDPQTSEAMTSKRVLTFGPPVLVGQSGNQCRFDISDDGRNLAVPDENGVSIFSLQTPGTVRSIGPHEDVRDISFSGDGRQMATGGWKSGNACIWDVESGRLLKTLEQPPCCNVFFSPDGKTLVTVAEKVTIWRTDDWSTTAILEVPGGSTNGVQVCFTPDSSLLAVSDSTARIHLVNPVNGTEYITLTDPNQHIAARMKFCPDGNRLAVVCFANGGVAHLWDLAAIREELSLRTPSVGFVLPTTATTYQPVTKAVVVKFVPGEAFAQFEASRRIRTATLAAESYNIPSARAAISRALELEPRQSLDCNNLSWLLATGPMSLRDSANALLLAQRAMKDTSLTTLETSLFLNTLGIAQFRAGLIDDAVRTLNRSVVAQQPATQPYDLYFLAMCHSRLGDKVAARAYFDQAEMLVEKYRDQLPQSSQNELDQFSAESEAMLPLLQEPATTK